MRIKLTVSYDGTDFVGWQRQSLPGANNRSVQGELERALRRLLHEQVSVQGAGRTDSGVHACGQAASFEADLHLPPDRLAYALNNVLPADVRVLWAESAAADFHARFSAKSKEYRYFLVANGGEAGAFSYRYAWFCPYRLDTDKMAAAAGMFAGEHNFRSFCGKSAVVKSYIRSLSLAEFGPCSAEETPEHLRGLAQSGALYCFRVAGNGFIYKMVRLLTGSLVKLGAGALSRGQLEAALSRELSQPLAPAAPPQGLYLWRIDYEK